MKPLLQRLPNSKDSSFVYERYVSPYFETPWHYHEEYEIVLCDGGFGKKVVGNHTSEYQENDLMLLGSNLPHWFRADDIHYSIDSNPKPASIVLQFRLDSFGELFFELTEFASIKKVLEKARFGLAFYGKTRDILNERIRKNLEKSALEKFLGLFEILRIMADADEIKTLSDIGMEGISSKDSERMSIVFDQIIQNFKEDISIEKIADEVNLSKAAFCRYFKARTQKTFVEYLIGVRLNHACKLLRETDKSVIEICYESGYKNLSNFNRQFRIHFNISPKQYRKLK
ncbi:AraC family transcriptional regulator [Lacihabitans sp. LS3-19]|uniref:AraC family transcriptional regulator n=1 Tax=Lacihabitans sp. LS3-19 TaxID=2487335 RepID=UPI0020CBBED0|nr:AraC family transcriptional regulator [Lacihabitans sp. LS3-19]MCP9769618.1 AraC family transcriptional regulator [Lacihabitans sp. LS3-19]